MRSIGLVVILLTLLVAQSHPVSAERTAVDSFIVELMPIADTYVNMSDPLKNYGTLESMEVNSQTLAYIMFDLSSLPVNATIVDATLKLYCYAGTYMPVGSGYISAHYCSDNSWIETGITWENKPSYEPEATDTETHDIYLGWDYWYVTKDVQMAIMKEDKRLTIVLKNYNIEGSYRSREAGVSRVILKVEYLSPPAYVLIFESKQDTGETSNIGFVKAADKIWPLPTELLAKPGAYLLEYDGEYEFVKWEATGGIRVLDMFSERTTLIVEGTGRLTAIGKIAKLTLVSAPDTGGTSNIGYIIIDNTSYVLPGEIIIKPGTYTVTYDGGYEFLRWETSGTLSVLDMESQTTMISVSAGLGTLKAIGSVDLVEYTYDYGKPKSYEYENEDTGGMWAVRFTPLFSGKLVKARFYILDEPAPVKIHIMDQEKNDIITPFKRVPVSKGWFDVDLSEFNIQVKTKRDFYIGIEWIESYKPKLGYDISEPCDKRSWQWYGTSWSMTPTSWEDIMIRAVVKTQSLSSMITCSLYPTSIPYKGRISISGSVSPADPETADVPVTLQFSSDEVYWFNITNISCVLSNYSYSWTPELPAGDYFIRAVWSGSDTYLGTESTHQSLIISKTQTTLTCRFDKEMIEVDKDVGVSGSISPAINDVIVTLMFTPPDGNSFIETVKTSSDGSFHFEIKTSQEGTWKVKAYWPGNENCFGSESTDSEMRVANPPSYLIVVLLVTIVGVTIISGISMFFVLRGREKKGGLPSTPTTYTPPSPPPPPESPKEEPPPRPSEKKPRYFEKDNMGTRQDSLSSANAYWIARISSPKVPFVVYTFDAEKDARDALLELDCIHVAEDTGKLICTKVLIYGYYLTEEGKYEVIVCGDELTHELWEKAKESFAKHGGKWKNDQEPEVRVVPVTEIKEPEIDKIVFVREDRRLTYGQTMIYRIYRGPDAATAKAFLQQNPVTRQYYYIVVETPEGNYARDIYGIYKE